MININVIRKWRYLPLLVVDAGEVPVDNGIVGAEVESTEVGGNSSETQTPHLSSSPVEDASTISVYILTPSAEVRRDPRWEREGAAATPHRRRQTEIVPCTSSSCHHAGRRDERAAS